jgi:hypothetical protein
MRSFLLNRKLVWAVAMWAIFISIPPTAAQAMPSASLATFNPVSSRDAQIDKIVSELSVPAAQVHLKLMGVDRAELKARLAQLDDAQLASVSQKAGAVKVAGDAGLGILITLLVIGILAIIFYRLANNKKIVA